MEWYGSLRQRDERAGHQDITYVQQLRGFKDEVRRNLSRQFTMDQEHQPQIVEFSCIPWPIYSLCRM